MSALGQMAAASPKRTRQSSRSGGKCEFAASQHEGERTAKADIDLKDFLIGRLGEGCQGSRLSLLGIQACGESTKPDNLY